MVDVRAGEDHVQEIFGKGLGDLAAYASWQVAAIFL